ncbi:dTDP-4-dehydrorhamnose reductase, partial [Bordetella bronchiseptica]
MNILLLGRTGQIGDALLAHPPAWARLAALERRQADLRDLGRLAAVLDAYAPRILINAAAYTEVDRAEAEPELALRINAQAVAVMADYARRNNALLVHYSTDYVFDGKRARAYRETDAAHPLNAYGRSKLAGEQAIAASGCPHLILRTSWVYASHGANFVKTILRLARTRAELSVVADQHGAPTWAGRIATVTWQAIDAHRRRRLPDGLWHLSAGGHVSWHGLACHIVARA